MRGLTHQSQEVAIGTSPTLVAAVSADRLSLFFQNQGATDIYLGGPEVAAEAGGGILLAGGQTPPAGFADDRSGVAWYAIAASATSLFTHAILP